jgi:hypothetical protein
MIEEENRYQEISERESVIKRKWFISRWSLKAFAFIAVTIMILSAYAGGDPPPATIDVSVELPWEQTYFPFPGGQSESIKFVNVTTTVSVVLQFDGTTMDSDLKVDDSVVGTLKGGMRNIFILKMLNGTEPIVNFWATEGLNLKIERLEESWINGTDNAHIFGKTHYNYDNSFVTDILFPEQTSKEIVLKTAGALTYYGFNEFPVSKYDISVYGKLFNDEATIELPRGSNILRLSSYEETDFDIDTSPLTFDKTLVIDVIGTSQNNGTTQFVRTINSVKQIEGVSQECTDPVDNISVTNLATYTITVSNIGNGFDRYDLSLSGDTGSATLSESVVNLNFNGLCDFHLTNKCICPINDFNKYLWSKCCV